MKSQDKTMENLDNAGEVLGWGGNVEEANMSGNSIEGRVGGTNQVMC